jgi:IS5 family transposase
MRGISTSRFCLHPKSGCRQDGTFVEVPKQHNSKTKNNQIKRSEIPERFVSEPHVGCPKETDTRWSKKDNENHFGYKNHVLVDSETKLISDYEVTAASVHDSIPCLELVPPEPLYEDQKFITDSAYLGSQNNPIQDDLKERKFSTQIIEKGIRNQPLTPRQRFWDRVKSSVRCRVEHVFGEQKKRMGDETLRTIDGKRATFWIGMRNIVSNMSCAITLMELKR